jgi:DNA repair exonuclease SbcCD ATPase subunit
MQLLRLEVRNWVHHRYRVCEFTRGLVAILGENGSGKSSLFGAIRWLLTGENPNYGVKSDNISQYAKEGEPAYASLEFEHRGHIAVVTRHLLPEKEQATFTIDGVETGRGDKAVTAAIEKFLGVDAKFISRFIIVGQTDIFSFIDDSQSETDKFFQRLFNTAKADKCQDLIGKNVAKISMPEIVRTSAVVAQERAAAEEKLAELQRQLKKMPNVDELLEAQAADQKTQDEFAALTIALAEAAKWAKQIKDLEAEIASVDEELAQYESDMQALDAASAGQEEAIAAARTALGHWKGYKSVAASREKLQATLAEIAEKRAKDPEPEKPGLLSSSEIHRDHCARGKRIKEIEEFIRVFDEEGAAECPTCHTPSAQLAAKVAEQKTVLAAKRVEYDELGAAFFKQRAIENNHVDWQNRERDRASLEQKTLAAEQQLQEMPAPELDETESQQIVADYEAFQAARKGILPLAETARVRKAKIEGSLTFSRERHATNKKHIEATTITQEEADAAAVRLSEVRSKLVARNTADQAVTLARLGVQNLEKEYAHARGEESRARKLRQWLSVSERTRDALKNAPRLVAQRNLQRLEMSINELLLVFGVNFQVKVSEDGSPTFIAEFYDGRRQVAQRLSIGQKTVLAIAFRVAVNAMYAEEIGLLALDEPTASLDAPRIRALAPVLEKLRELSTAKGLQCLLVTHAASLSNLFESAIELEPPELRHATTN